MIKFQVPKVIGILAFFCLVLVNVNIYPAKGQSQKSQPLPSEGKGFSLQECIVFAARNSYEVKLARLDFLIKETDQGRAEAIFDTLLSAEVSYEEDKREQLSALSADQSQENIYSVEATKKFPTGTEITLSFEDARKWSNSQYVSRNPAHTAEAFVELRQPVGKNIFGYVDRRSISVISLAIENAGLDTKERIEVLFTKTEKAYWEWAFTKKALEIYRYILEKAKDLHRTNAKNYDTGLIERGDFLASEANVLLREKDVLIAENKYRHAEEYIKLLMNIDTSERIHPAQALEYKSIELVLDDCLSLAFRKRRDYLKAKREIEIKNIVLETKANERWPEIDLVASMRANGIESKFSRAAEKLTGEDYRDYYAGVEISIPLENNAARSEFKKAKAGKEKAILTAKKLERAIVTEVGGVFLDCLTYDTNVGKLKEAYHLQEEKLQEEEKRFKYGRSNTKRLIDYQQDYLNAQLQLAGGLLELEVARTNLRKSLNIILQKYAGVL